MATTFSWYLRIKSSILAFACTREDDIAVDSATAEVGLAGGSIGGPAAGSMASASVTRMTAGSKAARGSFGLSTTCSGLSGTGASGLADASARQGSGTGAGRGPDVPRLEHAGAGLWEIAGAGTAVDDSIFSSLSFLVPFSRLFAFP